MAGNPWGIYSAVVPSSRFDAVGIIREPAGISDRHAPPHVPTRIRYCAPALISSSAAMALDEQPIPVEQTVICFPRYVQMPARNSRLLAAMVKSSRYVPIA